MPIENCINGGRTIDIPQCSTKNVSLISHCVRSKNLSFDDRLTLMNRREWNMMLVLFQKCQMANGTW